MRLHTFFEAQVRMTPHAEALVCGHDRVRYSELNQRANRLAHHLRALGVGPETLVAVCLPRGADLLVAVLGVSRPVAPTSPWILPIPASASSSCWRTLASVWS